MPARRPTLESLATELGVSRQTVSNVLNRPGVVAEPTRERVAAAISAAGYVPSRAGRQLRTQRSHAIGIRLMPTFDGINGHIGLNEPGSTADDPTRVVTLEARSRSVAIDRYGAAAAPERGITLGIGRLLESREIWLLVTGERKAAVLAEALDGPESADLPASFLRRHPRLRVIADEPAAGLPHAAA